MTLLSFWSPGWVATTALVVLAGRAEASPVAQPAARAVPARSLRQVPVSEIDPGKEYGVKAGFLANFVKYTTWPENSFSSPTAPLVVAIAGRNKYAGAIEKVLRARKYKGRDVHVVRTDDIGPDVHAVFSTGMDAAERAALADACVGRPVLLVGEYDDYASQGAGLNFYIEKGKVRFEANPTALRAVGLKVSSELLKLARTVTSEAPR